MPHPLAFEPEPCRQVDRRGHSEPPEPSGHTIAWHERMIAGLESDINAPDWLFGSGAAQERIRYREAIAAHRHSILLWTADEADRLDQVQGPGAGDEIRGQAALRHQRALRELDEARHAMEGKDA